MRHLPLVSVALLLFACNEPPGEPVVVVGPDGATTVDDLAAVIATEAPDENKNDVITYTYSWTVNGNETDITGPDVSADRTRAGDTWTVTVTPSDSKLVGIPSAASITVANTPPTATATITPDTPLSSDDLNITIETDDIDGDTVNTVIGWTRDGANANITSSRVPADRTRPGEVWEATVTPRDAREAGEDVVVSVQIQNQAPFMESVTIRPGVAFESSVLEAVPDATDPDGDDITWTYEWSINDVGQGPGSDRYLDGASFDRGDTVTVTVTANDGLIDSDPMQSDALEIANTPPIVTDVSVTPAEPFEDSTMSCVGSGWADDDGDAEDYRYSWTVDGVVIGSGQTIDGAAFDKGDRVVCEVFPWDGIDEGRSVASRPIEVQNTPPEITKVEISPEDPVSGTDITATVTGAYDLDGDDVTVDIGWFVDGRKVASGAILPAGSYIKDEAIYATATPDDGDEEGASIKSNTVTSVNAPPTIVSMAITPIPLLSRENVTVDIVTDDWDGDTVELSYAWTINGDSYGTSSTITIPSGDTGKGDIVALTVSTNDGEVDGDVASDSQTVKLYIAPPEIAFDPEYPEADDDVYCKITKDSVDSDGGKITYYFSWLKDGVEYKGSTDTTVHSGDTVPYTATANEEEWTCQVYASSPNGASTTAELDVLIGGLQTFSFTDKTSDDIVEKSLDTFFDGLDVKTTWYMYFEIDTGSTAKAWCSERADWYVDNYLTYASGSTTLSSGSWKKWSYNGSSWSSATTTGYSNYFGTGCDSQAYSWCSNWGIGGNNLGIMPKQTGNESYSSGWRSADWDVTIQVAPSKKLACGF